MIIDCISDLHGYYPELHGGDLLIVAGDLTARDTEFEIFEFFSWLHDQPYNKKIVIGGNHDNILEKENEEFKKLHNPKSNLTNIEYLCDSGTEITYYPRLDPPNLDNIGVVYKRKTFKIWGSPWTKTFEGMNPKCKAFTVDTEEELAVKFSLIPDDIDILVTHSPGFMCFDETMEKVCVGSVSLASKIRRINPKLHVFGHIHECGGKISDGRKVETNYVCKTISVNASLVNESYQPVNKPIRILL